MACTHYKTQQSFCVVCTKDQLYRYEDALKSIRRAEMTRGCPNCLIMRDFAQDALEGGLGRSVGSVSNLSDYFSE